MDRRKFLQVASATGFSLSATRPAHLVSRERVHQNQVEQTFRTITYNILAARGYPGRPENKSRLERARPQMAQRFAIELGLYQPDLITFQESPAEETVARIAELLGMKYVYFPGGFPGTLITKHAIKESVNCPLAGGERPADLFTRHWGKALLQVKEMELVVYTAHLHPGKEEATRTREVDLMLASMSDDLASGKNLILQGDLNHGPDSQLYERWKEAGLQDSFALKGIGEGLTISSTDLRWRIDYIWSAGPLSKKLTECRVLAEGPFIDHPDDLAGFALSDHLPVTATFSLG